MAPGLRLHSGEKPRDWSFRSRSPRSGMSGSIPTADWGGRRVERQDAMTPREIRQGRREGEESVSGLVLSLLPGGPALASWRLGALAFNPLSRRQRLPQEPQPVPVEDPVDVPFRVPPAG